MNDLRTPIGIFFSLAGAIVAATGLFTDNRAPLEAANLNLYWGLVMLVFGGAMLWMARRSA